MDVSGSIEDEVAWDVRLTVRIGYDWTPRYESVRRSLEKCSRQGRKGTRRSQNERRFHGEVAEWIRYD